MIELRELRRIVAARTRAVILRVRGATLGAATNVGRRVMVNRPAGLSAGIRCEFEHDVFLKLVSPHARIKFGSAVFIGRGSEIDAAGSISVGDHSLIAPNVFITDHEHRIETRDRIDTQGIHIADVTIGSDVWIGTGSVVLPGVRIGDGAVIGANSVVNSDVAPYSVVAGSPARFIRERG